MIKKCICAILALCSAALLFTACGKAQPTDTAEVPETTTTVETTVPEETGETTVPTTALDPTEKPEDLPVDAGVTSREDFDKEPSVPEPGNTDGQSPTKPPVTEPPVQEPTVKVPEDTEPPADITDPYKVTYAQYLAMTDEEEEAFVESFPSLREFNLWRKAALEKVPEQEKEILDGNEIDLGKYTP